jgi:ribosomal protein L12E/L44/L45/RPP1/RPP2
METAYAKLKAEHRPNESIQDELHHIGNGGNSADALYTLTGQRDTSSVQASALSDPNKAYATLHHALDQKRPVLLETNAMHDMPHDGLVKGTWNANPAAKRSGHAYIVERVYKDPQGDVMLTVRNPWGNNNDPRQGVNSSSPTVEVKLKEIIANGHLDRIEVGPAPALHKDQAQEQAPQPASPANNQPQQEQRQDAAVPAVTGDPYMDRLLAAMDNPAAFGQALDDLAHSPHGEAFRTEGRAQYAEQENQQQLRQQQEEQAQQQQQQSHQGLGMSR